MHKQQVRALDRVAEVIWQNGLSKNSYLSLESIVLVLTFISKRDDTGHIRQLNFLEWSILLESTRQLSGYGKYNWRMLYLLVLRIGIRDFLSQEPAGGLERCRKIDWLSSLSRELSPQGFLRENLLPDNSGEFTEVVVPLLDVLHQSAEVLDASRHLKTRIIRAKKMRPTARVRKIRSWFVREEHWMMVAHA